MDSRLLRFADRQLREGRPYALAVVVRRERPSSASPGNTAVITADGKLHGWIGGSCTQPEVVRHALEAIRDGKPRLLAFGAKLTDRGHHDGGFGGDSQAPEAADDRSAPHVAGGETPVPMACGSEGKVDVHVNPVFPKPELVVVGESPIAEALVRLGDAMGYGVTGLPSAEALASAIAGRGAASEDDTQRGASWAERARGAKMFAIVATMGRGDERAAAQLLAAKPDYLGVVASPKRMAGVRETLRTAGICGSRIDGVHGPAGLDIGAERPEEVAVSILAEVVAVGAAGQGSGALPQQLPHPHRGAATPQPSASAPALATDPVCGMTVPTDGSRPSATHRGSTFHFCCPGCRARFEADPPRYAVAP